MARGFYNTLYFLVRKRSVDFACTANVVCLIWIFTKTQTVEFGRKHTFFGQLSLNKDLRWLPRVCSVTTRFIEIRRCPRVSAMECSWPAIKLFKVFKVRNNCFCRYFCVSTHNKSTSSSLQSFVFASLNNM